jgi:hypothetical protein
MNGQLNQVDGGGRTAGPWQERSAGGGLSGEAAFRDGHQTGQWRTYAAAGRLTKTRTCP